jgi:hypothetical protein
MITEQVDKNCKPDCILFVLFILDAGFTHTQEKAKNLSKYLFSFFKTKNSKSEFKGHFIFQKFFVPHRKAPIDHHSKKYDYF